MGGLCSRSRFSKQSPSAKTIFPGAIWLALVDITWRGTIFCPLNWQTASRTIRQVLTIPHICHSHWGVRLCRHGRTSRLALICGVILVVPSTREIESHSHMDRSIASKSETAYFCRAKLSYEARCEKASIMGVRPVFYLRGRWRRWGDDCWLAKRRRALPAFTPSTLYL